jgi:SAM-dependent methyltransferase
VKKTPGPSPALRLRDFPGFSREDLANLKRYYALQLRGHSVPARRVGWNSEKSQRLRFQALVSVAPLGGSKVLDIGCGLGALWAYLREKRIPADYRGVDLFPRVVEEAAQLHPEAKFEVRQVTARPFPAGAFDFSLLSGVFNVKVRDNWEYMRAVLTAALRQSRRAVAFNVLKSGAGLREADRFSARPGDLAAFGRSLGVRKVRLLENYHPLDLTLFLYKA